MAKFQFKSFSLNQSDSSFKIGTDACLLGAWTEAKSQISLLDIGVGTGVISAMIAQRYRDLQIFGVDLNPASVVLAEENFAQHQSIKDYQVFLKDLNSWEAPQAFDLIVSNPPFFANSEESKRTHLAKARHQSSLSLNEILKFSSEYLNENGSLALIMPISELEGFREQMGVFGFYINRLALLKPLAHKEVHRAMLQISKTESKPEEEHFEIEKERGQYSERAYELLKDYLLLL